MTHPSDTKSLIAYLSERVARDLTARPSCWRRKSGKQIAAIGPVRVLAAARKHHDELMHEFSLLAVHDPDRSDGTVPARLRDLVGVLGRRYGAASSRPDAVIDEALDRGDRV